MLKEKITYLIFSCDKFSDLWQGNLLMLNKYWPDHDFDIYLVSDKETDKKIEGVTILCPGENVAWTDRLKYALQFVKTKYVFLTLDDYFLIKPVNSSRMEMYINLMDDGNYDYIRFYPRPKAATRDALPGLKKVYNVENKCMYSVNLYSCLWTKDFLAFTVNKPQSPWDYEVGLYKQAVAYNAKCLVCNNKEYQILDVVRKGKILHRAKWYFSRHPGIYDGNREVQSIWFELKLFVKTEVNRRCPDFMRNTLRRLYVKMGGTTFVKEESEV